MRAYRDFHSKCSAVPSAGFAAAHAAWFSLVRRALGSMPRTEAPHPRLRTPSRNSGRIFEASLNRSPLARRPMRRRCASPSTLLRAAPGCGLWASSRKILFCTGCKILFCAGFLSHSPPESILVQAWRGTSSLLTVNVPPRHPPARGPSRPAGSLTPSPGPPFSYFLLNNKAVTHQ